MKREQVIHASDVLRALTRHIGKHNGASVDQLVTEITGDTVRDKYAERRVRDAVVHLRNEGHHVCAHPSSGYYMAATPEELEETCAFLIERAMTTLKQVAAMKRISLPDLRGQLHLPT